jgi:hypothetical protein
MLSFVIGKQNPESPIDKAAADAQTERYLNSPDGRKMAARVILAAQFPGWCQWSSAEMIVRPNGDVFVRCNGDFAVDTNLRVGMRLQ